MRLHHESQQLPGWRNAPRQEGKQRGSVVSLLTVATLSLVTLVVPASPAAADPATAMRNCQDGKGFADRHRSHRTWQRWRKPSGWTQSAA